MKRWSYAIFSIGFSIILFNICKSVKASTPVLQEVEITNGKIVGQEFFSRNGRSYFGFRGIPYGLIPERFKSAEPFPSWTKTRNALEFGNSCPSFDVISKTLIGNEDCLHLNVYTPVLNKGKTVSTLVWIHGGAFEMGRSDDHDAKYFMDEDTILVTINYRLGALGFLSTADSVVSGNNGMKDQTLALKWVQKNIQSFGGDPNKVTIFGESAGGASVHYHMLSPMSKGLFQNAISQSGSALNHWAFQPYPKVIAEKFAKHLNCPVDSSETLIICLNSKTVEEILIAQSIFKQWSIFPFNVFAPTLEPEGSEGSKFLPKMPEEIISSGNFNRVPWITGFNEDEGAMLSPLIITNDNLTKDMNDDWNRVAPILLNYDAASEKIRNETSEKILNFYFESEEVGEETWQSLTDMLSDRYMIHGIDKAAKLHAKFAPVYPYVFSFPGGDPTVLRVMFGITGEHGVAHADELQYLFNGFFGSPEYIEQTQHEPLDLSQKFIKLWVSFSKESVPTSTWKDTYVWKPLATATTVEYYEIAAETRVWDTDIQDRMAFWNDLNDVIDHFEPKSSDGSFIEFSDKKDEL